MKIDNEILRLNTTRTLKDMSKKHQELFPYGSSLIEIEELMELIKNETKKDVRKSTCQELLEWAYNYEYKTFLFGKRIVMEDLQIEEEQKIFENALEFMEYWIETWNPKYDFNKNSYDRNICGDEFLDNLLSINSEYEVLKS